MCSFVADSVIGALSKIIVCVSVISFVAMLSDNKSLFLKNYCYNKKSVNEISWQRVHDPAILLSNVTPISYLKWIPCVFDSERINKLLNWKIFLKKSYKTLISNYRFQWSESFYYSGIIYICRIFLYLTHWVPIGSFFL